MRRILLTLLVVALSVCFPGQERSAVHGATPIGLSVFFADGVMSPLVLIGDAPRYLQEIDVIATEMTSTDEGITPVTQQGDLSRLDWAGVRQVEEDWRPAGDGTYIRQRFYRDARWMNTPSTFRFVPVDGNGTPVGPPILASAGRDDRLTSGDDAFVRRFVARQIASGCPAIGNCEGATYAAQALVQLRQALNIAQRASRVPPQTARLVLEWTLDPEAIRAVEISRVSPSDAPFDYGFQVRIATASSPTNGRFYVPGEQVSFQLTFLDGAGNRLHPQGSLPTYGQFFRGEVASGLRYFDNFRLSPTLYYALKHREGNIIVALSGPTDRLKLPSGVVGLDQLFAPAITVATVPEDGFSSLGAGVPPFAVTFGGLFDPAVWDTPVSDLVQFTIPTDALPGSYVAAVKARRSYGGEAINRGATATIQVGTTVPTHYTLKTIPCNTCHTGPSALGRILHGLDDRRACYGCHGTLSVEPDTALDIRVHTVHDRSRRFAGDVNDCQTCHLEAPQAPARGLLNPQ